MGKPYVDKKKLILAQHRGFIDRTLTDIVIRIEGAPPTRREIKDFAQVVYLSSGNPERVEFRWKGTPIFRYERKWRYEDKKTQGVEFRWWDLGPDPHSKPPGFASRTG